MNIHYLSHSVLISDSANSVHVMKMCDALAGFGLNVTLHGVRGQGGDSDVASYYGVHNEFGVIRYDARDQPALLALQSLRRNVPFLRLGQVPLLLQGLLSVRQRLINGRRPDLIYARNLEWLWAAAPMSVPFVLECHAPPANRLAHQITKRLIRRPTFRGLVIISNALRDIYVRDFPELRTRRLMVAHDGADLPSDDQIPRIRTNERFTIGYVGHLYEGRGGELMLELARRCPEFDFNFVGGTREDIARLKAGPCPSNAIFHGHAPHREVWKLYSRFDAVLAPYQSKVKVHGGAGDTAKFMSPLKIFEYMAWGRPILCSDLPALREILAHEQNALLLPPDDVNAWQCALQRLRSDPALAERLGVQSREDLKDRFTWRARAETVLRAIGVRLAPDTASDQ